jgi:hypothetical protein
LIDRKKNKYTSAQHQREIINPDLLEDIDDECGGFPGAGLSLHNEIATMQ